MTRSFWPWGWLSL